MKQARGMRNNNPLNIIKSEKINWQGEVKPSTDPNFAQFETLEYGLRAAFKLLQTYYTKHGCKTITQIISRWAPETENQVVAYIKAVSQRTGIARTRTVCRSWVDTEEVKKASPPAPPQKGRGGKE